MDLVVRQAEQAERTARFAVEQLERRRILRDCEAAEAFARERVEALEAVARTRVEALAADVDPPDAQPFHGGDAEDGPTERPQVVADAYAGVRQTDEHVNGVKRLKRRGEMPRRPAKTVWSLQCQWMLHGVTAEDQLPAIGHHGMTMVDRIIQVLERYPECWDLELEVALASPTWIHITPARLRSLRDSENADPQERQREKELARDLANMLYARAEAGIRVDWEYSQSGSRDPMDDHEMEPFNFVHHIAKLWNESLGWCLHCTAPLEWKMQGGSRTREELAEMTAEDRAAY